MEGETKTALQCEEETETEGTERRPAWASAAAGGGEQEGGLGWALCEASREAGGWGEEAALKAYTTCYREFQHDFTQISMPGCTECG